MDKWYFRNNKQNKIAVIDFGNNLWSESKIIIVENDDFSNPQIQYAKSMEDRRKFCQLEYSIYPVDHNSEWSKVQSLTDCQIEKITEILNR